MNQQAQSAGNGLSDLEVIYSYTRAQAIKDGVLVDLTQWAREAGFTYPLAVTQNVWAVLKPSKEAEAKGEDVAGRAWDMFTILRHAIKGASRPDEVYFSPLFLMEPGDKVEPVDMWSKCGPGDDGEPVITVMLQGED